MVSFGLALSVGKISVDLFPVRKVVGQRAVNLLQGEGWVTLYHPFSRNSFTEQVYQRIKGDASPRDPIHALIHTDVIHC